MTIPHWYVDTYILEGKPQAFDKIRKALENYQVTYTKYIPFSERQEGLDSVFNPYQLNLVYGTHGFIRNMQKTFGKGSISPYLTESEMECIHYYGKIPEDWLLNSGCYYVPFYGLASAVSNTFTRLPTVFVRPNSGFKAFIPQVISTWEPDITNQVEEIRRKYQVEDETLCLVSPSQLLRLEIRYVIVDRKVISASFYRLNGEHYEAECFVNTPAKVMYNYQDTKALAEKMAAHDWQPGLAYMCDIALTVEGVCKIVELNTFCCAGLYDCDYDKVFKAVTEAYAKNF